MRRLFKKVIIAYCCLAMLLAASVPALAADGSSLYVESGLQRGDMYHVFFNVSSDQTPEIENLHLLVNETEMPVSNVVTYDYVDAGTTYFVLVDSSTSVIERALRDIKQVVLGIAGGMSMYDNMYVGQLGETYDDSGFMDSAQQIAARVEDLSMEMPGDDLYQSMADALDLLSTSAEVKQRKCLVVIADGMDANADGISVLELQSKIEQAHLPVCTIALTYGTKNADRISAAKDLSGLARQSCGGVDVLLMSDGVTTDDAVLAVLSVRAHTYAAVLESAAIRAVTTEPSATFEVTWTTDEGTCSGEYELDISGIPVPEVESEPEPEVSPVPEAEITPEPTAEPQPSQVPEEQPESAAWPAWLTWVLIVGLLLIAAAVTAFMLMKKRRTQQVKPQAPVSAVRYDAPPVSQPMPVGTPAAMFDGPEIVLVRTGKDEGIRCSLKMTQPLVIGRDPARAQLVFEEDPRLGSAQCRLDWKDGKLWISELDPQGTTMLNGVPVGEGFYVQPGDLLFIGSHEYRVFWEYTA